VISINTYWQPPILVVTEFPGNKKQWDYKASIAKQHDVYMYCRCNVQMYIPGLLIFHYLYGLQEYDGYFILSRNTDYKVVLVFNNGVFLPWRIPFISCNNFSPDVQIAIN